MANAVGLSSCQSRNPKVLTYLPTQHWQECYLAQATFLTTRDFAIGELGGERWSEGGGRGEGGRATCWPALSPLSVPISVSEVNGEHKTYLKATFTTWLIPLHCVISRCHISSPHVCLNALPSLWLVRLRWLLKSSLPHPILFTSSWKAGQKPSPFSKPSLVFNALWKTLDWPMNKIQNDVSPFMVKTIHFGSNSEANDFK